MLNLFKSQAKSSKPINLSNSQELWRELSLDECSSYAGGWWEWDGYGRRWWCRETISGGVVCRHKATGVP